MGVFNYDDVGLSLERRMGGTGMVTYFGLYYPFIHFRNEGWLKLAALYWDGMNRIVPMGASLHDSDEVKRLVDAQFIQNRAPFAAADKVAKPFRDLVAVHGDDLRAKFAIAKSGTWPDDRHTRLYAPGRDRKLAYVFDEKMDKGLLGDLHEHGLVATRTDDPRWIGMHPKLVSVYMMALAEAMAPMLGAHPLTDRAFNHVAVSGFTMERLAAALLEQPELAAPTPADAKQEVEEAMASLAFSYVMPAAPAHIPAEEIVKLRKTYAEERGQFQAEVAKLTVNLINLQDLKDPREVEQHLKAEYDKTLAPRLERLREGLQKANIDTVEGAMAISFALPAGLAAALTAAGVTLAPPAAAVGGIAFAAWTIWRKHKKAVDGVLKPSPEAYLYRVSKLSTPRNVVSTILTNSRKFLSRVF
jgi:hypothetical protein